MMRSDSTIRAAIGWLEQAIVLDTAYAAAYAGQAEIYTTAMLGLAPDGRRDMYRRATDLAKRALALDSSSAEAYVALGIVHLFGYRLREAESELKHARELNPGVAHAGYLEHVYYWTGRTDDALVEAQREARDEPLSAEATAGLALALYFARRYDAANVEITKVMALHPPLRRAATYQAEILLAQHRWGDAIAAMRPPAQLGTRRKALLGYALGRSGARAEAMRVLAQLREGIPTGQGNAFMVAEVYAGLGDFDNAYIWLNRAIDDYSLLDGVMGPMFDDLRADPRFALIRKRLGLETP
jgi:tetratricopeptide (TPR) repeat protein